MSRCEHWGMPEMQSPKQCSYGSGQRRGLAKGAGKWGVEVEGIGVESAKEPRWGGESGWSKGLYLLCTMKSKPVVERRTKPGARDSKGRITWPFRVFYSDALKKLTHKN